MIKFDSDRENMAYVVLNEYFPELAIDHNSSVKNIYDRAISNGYIEEEISIKSGQTSDEDMTMLIISSVVSTPHWEEKVNTFIKNEEVKKRIKNTQSTYTKEENELILKKNNDLSLLIK